MVERPVGDQRVDARVRTLLRRRSYRRWLLAEQLSALPAAMMPLAFVLLAEYVTGSYHAGGLMVTVAVTTEVVCAPVGGRLLDRVGLARGVRVCLGLAAGAFGALAVAGAGWLSWPVGVLLVLAAASAALGAAVPGGFRTLLTHTVPTELMRPALSINSTASEIVIVTGPLIVAAVAFFGAPASVVAMAAAMALAALGAGLNPARPATESLADEKPARSVLRDRQLAFWLLSGVASGHVLSTVEVAALPIARELNADRFAASAIIAMLATASGISGLLYGVFGGRIRMTLTRQGLVLLGLMGVAGLLLMAGFDRWVSLASAVALLGLCTAPMGTVTSLFVEDLAPERRRSEVFSVRFAASGVGFAFGGLTLAYVPLRFVFLAGALSALVTIALAPIMLSRGTQHKSGGAGHRS